MKLLLVDDEVAVRSSLRNMVDWERYGYEVLEAEKRPVNAVADNTEVKSVISVRIAESIGLSARILSDPDHSWSDRILAEQFDY